MTINVDPPKTSLPARRPAETTAAGGGALTVALYALGAPEPLVAVAIAVTTLGPGAVTWVVNRGGVRGIARMLWAGRG